MTENTPDAVKIGREAVARRYDEHPQYAAEAAAVRAGERDQWNDISQAILGARAMQAAMAAQGGGA
ncbi:hypothetical protein, partial [Ancylobacter polymorphus]